MPDYLHARECYVRVETAVTGWLRSQPLEVVEVHVCEYVIWVEMTLFRAINFI